MVRVISFSLWGREPKYLIGAIRNAELSAHIYPGWRCRFACGASVPEDALARLTSFPHVEVVRRPEPGDWRGLFWRFLAAADPGVDAVVFRDADSRVNLRERAAVDAWLASGRAVHVMRDHPRHGVPMLGGMWGTRGGVLPDIARLVAGEARGDYWQVDQEFLAAVIAPRTRDSWLEHDEYFARRPFPTARHGRRFVGQPFDADDRPILQGPTATERRVGQAAHAALSWARSRTRRLVPR